MLYICFRCNGYHPDEHRVCTELDKVYFQYGSSSKFMLRLDKSLSVTNYPGHKGVPEACGLVALLFAHDVIQSKPLHTWQRCGSGEYIPLHMYDLLCTALRQGIDTYKMNYGETCKSLTVQEILLLLSEKNLTVVEEWIPPITTIKFITENVLNLKLNEIILIIRMDDYNVWSISRRDFPSDLILLDSQPHNVFNVSENKVVEHGALVVQLALNFHAISRTLSLLENYSGTFSKRCSIVLLKV